MHVEDDRLSQLPAPRLTHVALRVDNARDTAEFYRRYCGWEIVRVRETSPESGDILWVGPEPDDEAEPGFVLVLLEWPLDPSDNPAMDHLGLAVESREQVEEIAALAEAEGRLHFGPEQVDEVAGYLCTVRDPDGRHVEFSFGQPLEGM